MHEQHKPSEAGNLLNIQEAADYLRVSKSTLRRWCNAGILEHIRINGRGDRRFRRVHLDAVTAPCRTGRPRKKFHSAGSSTGDAPMRRKND
ncbi:MAG: helix-turn-helix domain-containing protein [bacterium]|nr:helix-turn-helix domain-containing protein [bacterium]MBK8128163.1 helix-turn-helix domain-containing protein [bacterium]